MTVPECRHCGKTWPKGSRGLCRSCSRTPEIRDRYVPRRVIDPTTACVNCHRRKASKARRLCQPCRRDPAIYAQYPPEPDRVCGRCGFRRILPGSNHSVVLCRDCVQGRPLPERIVEANRLVPTVGVGPVRALPCSALRLAVLIARAASGAPLWCEDDILEAGT